MNRSTCLCRTATRLVENVLKWVDYLEGNVSLSEDEINTLKQELISSARPYKFKYRKYDNNTTQKK